MYDVIIIGLGAMGSAAAFELANAGATVLGLEQFSPLHDQGSSHGKSRMIRKAYFEGDFYIPLLERSFEKWREMDAKTDEQLLDMCGVFYSGDPEMAVIKNTLASVKKYNLDVETLSAGDVEARFPAFQIGPGQVGLFEKEAGYVNPDVTLELYQRMAKGAGATLQFEERVEDILLGEGDVHIRTTKGDYKAKKLIITAGPWLGKFASQMGTSLPLEVWRMVLHWFTPAVGRENFAPPNFFANVCHTQADEIFYGFPWSKDDIGVKYAFHNRQNLSVNADNPVREISPNEIENIQTTVGAFVPGLKGAYHTSKTCLYTVSPDEHFFIGALPGHENVVVAGGFSGHGFKFTPVVGEILKDLALDGKTRFDISGFNLSRFK